MKKQKQHKIAPKSTKQPAEKPRAKELSSPTDPATVAKNTFISNVSHEIRTPMNAIMGFAQLLKSSGLNPQQADYLEVIMDSGKKLLFLINNLLDLSNLQMGKANLYLVDCDSKAKAERLWSHFRPMIVAKNLKPILELSEDLPMVKVDCDKLERVLSFIISNAIKFTNSGSITFRASFSRSKQGEGFLLFEVDDTGCGISEERLPHIFNAFEQADNSFTKQYPGLGLGLGLSSQIVALMGGEISASSKLGLGSCFKVKIPVDTY